MAHVQSLHLGCTPCGPVVFNPGIGHCDCLWDHQMGEIAVPQVPFGAGLQKVKAAGAQLAWAFALLQFYLVQ